MDRISIHLKGIEPKKRKDFLLVELDKVNKWMQSHIQSQVDSKGEIETCRPGQSQFISKMLSATFNSAKSLLGTQATVQSTSVEESSPGR